MSLVGESGERCGGERFFGDMSVDDRFGEVIVDCDDDCANDASNDMSCDCTGSEAAEPLLL